MQVYRIVLLYLAVLCLTAWIPVGFADKEDAVEEDAVADLDEPDVEVEPEPEASEEKEKPAAKKPTEIENYTPPVISVEHQDSVFLAEPFADPAVYKARWIQSQAKKDGVDENIAKYDGVWSFEEPLTKLFKEDIGLVLKSRARHHAISAKLDKKFDFKDKPFIVQYEVKFQQSMECGGAYVKLLADGQGFSPETFTDKSPYTIMFGPDKCGEDRKLHFIFRHKNPVNGSFEEKHAKKPSGNFQGVFDGKKTHLFTLVVRPDNTFEVFVDQESVSKGSLLEDMTPAVNPSKEIEDPDDKKPEDWDEREKIPDPDAEKPDDWDEDAPPKIADPDAKKPEGWLDEEPEYIPDPNGVKPDDWDDDEDGEWEAPQIANPKCEKVGCGEWKPLQIDNPNFKGKWSAPLITNPEYKGIWKPRMIPNPHYFEDKEPFKMTSIVGIGLELWSMTPEILFDNIIITNDKAVADKWAKESWVKKNVKETYGGSDEGGVLGGLLEATNERPWLWVLFVIVIILPFVLIAAFCFPGGKSDAAKKKTDEPTEDVAEEETKSEEREEPVGEEEEEEEKMEVDEKEEKEEENAEEEEPERRVTRRKARKEN
ncbi:calnexin-like [Actinia tenebrosa]|uniref:Calnexin-like n=1 Tax=Actinia tenebrosa TaxID=6105 RepID=A0A6P8HHA9_ACTTE|nr:calnexin-like [Actinia tenebrosa]